jgi:predicted transglutaminase-like cysteine proteinase
MALEHRAPEETTAAQQTSTPQSIHGQFMRSVGRSIRSYKLGDLLVASKLITPGQLDSALAVQKETGGKLGTILIEQGALSAVQLYRKLAEQWCIKASTAGVALMMQVLTPSVASADSNGSGTNGVRVASAFSTASVRPLNTPSYPGLFGTSEVRSNGVSMFPKWTAVMARFDQQMKTEGNSATVRNWKAQLSSWQGLPRAQQIDAVNRYINSVRYVEDSRNYHKSDQWATPIEFLTRGGDCEDFAIAKFASLRALGFSSDQLRIAIVQDKIKNVPHAILIVYDGGHTYVLDNQDKSVRDADSINRYKPIFSLNSNNWWLHKKA